MTPTYPPARLVFNWTIELGTVIVFWVAFKLNGLMSAILWSLIATLVALVLAILIQRRCPLFPLAMSIVVVIFGGYSLITQEPTAFVFQHTVYYGLGSVLLIIGVLNGKSFLKPLFDNLFALTDRGWIILARRWAFLFMLLACGNELVWRTLSESTWAVYKLAMTLTVTGFGLWQLRVARRERLPQANRWGFKIR